ncbi:hypothetical protein EVG20_g4135, partial [Dentipellis fragilis]
YNPVASGSRAIASQRNLPRGSPPTQGAQSGTIPRGFCDVDIARPSTSLESARRIYDAAMLVQTGIVVLSRNVGHEVRACPDLRLEPPVAPHILLCINIPAAMSHPVSPSRSSSAKGWRKPVPQYIPSPPASPPLSETPCIAAFSPEIGASNLLPPLPDDHLNIVRKASLQYSAAEMSEVQGAMSGPNVLYVPNSSNSNELASPVKPSLSSTLFYPIPLPGQEPPSSAQSPARRKASLPQIYRPPTPPLPSSRPKSYASPRSSTFAPAIRSPYRMIMPDPPSIYMKESTADLHRHSSAFPIPISPAPSSMMTGPSGMSMSSEKTAAGSLPRTKSWELPDYLQEEVDRQKQREVLPMFVLPREALAKHKRKRTCSGLVWDSFATAGRAVASAFRKAP